MASYLNGIKENEVINYDNYGFKIENTPMGESRSVTPIKLVGSTFSGGTVDTNFWTTSSGTGGSANVGNAQIFSNGLTLVVATANSNVTVTYE